MEELLKKIMIDYRETFSEEDININFIITDNIYEEYLKHIQRNRQEEIENNKEWLSNLNGTIILPKIINEPITILISKDYIKKCIDENNFSWIGTICHELTHAYDHIAIMKKLKIIEYKELEKYNNYYLFSQWTEFNARRKGYFFVRKYSFKNMYDEKQIEDIIKKELPYHINNYFEEYNKNGNDANMQIYCTMQFLGRLKTWKDLFPNYFTNGFLIQLFAENEWLMELFDFLNNNDEIDAIFNKFAKMKEILELNFKFERKNVIL